MQGSFFYHHNTIVNQPPNPTTVKGTSKTVNIFAFIFVVNNQNKLSSETGQKIMYCRGRRIRA